MYSASEKLAIIRLVEDSELSIRRTLDEMSVSRSSFYRWYRAYERDGPDGLQNHSRASRQHWNRIPDSVLVRVDSGEDHVRVVKEDGRIVIRVWSAEEHVNVAIPVHMVSSVVNQVERACF